VPRPPETTICASDSSGRSPLSAAALRIESAAFDGPTDKIVTSPPWAAAIFRLSSIANSSR